MRRRRWAAAAVLAALAAAVAAAWILPDPVQPLADDDVLVENLSPPFRAGSRSVRLQALICEGTIGQSQRPILVTRDPTAAERLIVLASQWEVHRGVLHGDCPRLDRCRVHVLEWWSRPSRTYELPQPPPARGPSFAPDWSLCELGPSEGGPPYSRPAVERTAPMQAVTPPLLWPRAFFDLNLIRSTSFAFAPLWLAGLLVIAAVRTGSWLWLALTFAPVALAVLFVLPVTLLAGLVVLIDLGAVLTAALLGAVWVLTRRTLRSG